MLVPPESPSRKSKRPITPWRLSRGRRRHASPWCLNSWKLDSNPLPPHHSHPLFAAHTIEPPFRGAEFGGPRQTLCEHHIGPTLHPHSAPNPSYPQLNPWKLVSADIASWASSWGPVNTIGRIPQGYRYDGRESARGVELMEPCALAAIWPDCGVSSKRSARSMRPGGLGPLPTFRAPSHRGPHSKCNGPSHLI